MKVTKFALIVSSAINFILIFISIELFFEINNLFREKPELIKKITTSEISKAKIEFSNLIKKKFPIGLSEIELIQELDEQGFNPGWSYDNQHNAFFETVNIGCRSSWSIIWEVDKHGNVTEINGKYIATCL